MWPFSNEHAISKYLDLNFPLNLVERTFNNLIKRDKNFFNNKDFILADDLLDKNYSSEKYIVELTRRICKNIGLEVKEIVVTFAYADGNSGLVTFVNNNCFIEISSYFKDNLFAISTILVHELTHVWMDRNLLNIVDEEENEKTTDVMAFFLGLGVIFLNGVKETSNVFINYRKYKEQQLKISHYIQETTMGYAFILFLKQKHKKIKEINKYVRTQFAKDIIERGNSKYKERKKLLKKSIKVDKIIIHCPNCFSNIRIDATNKVKIKCPICDYVYDFDINNK